MEHPVDDDLDNVVWYLLVAESAQRPAKPVLVVLVSERGDVPDGVEDKVGLDRLSRIGQERYSKPSYFGSPRARLDILRNFATRRKR
jgi:hypothetical protein